MRFVITDSNGNLLDSFEDESTARLALREMAGEDPEDQPFLLAYSDDGTPVGDAMTADDLPVAVVRSVKNANVLSGVTCATSGDVVVRGLKVQGTRVAVSATPRRKAPA